VRARCPRHALPQGLRDKVHHGPRRRVGIHLGVIVIIAEAAKKKEKEKKRKNKKKSTNKEFTRGYRIKSKKQPSATQYSTSNIQQTTTKKNAVGERAETRLCTHLKHTKKKKKKKKK
jgi:hypothetical protein